MLHDVMVDISVLVRAVRCLIVNNNIGRDYDGGDHKDYDNDG